MSFWVFEFWMIYLCLGVVILVTAVSTQPLEKFLKEYKGTLEIIPLTIPDSLGTAEAVLHAKKYIKVFII